MTSYFLDGMMFTFVVATTIVTLGLIILGCLPPGHRKRIAPIERRGAHRAALIALLDNKDLNEAFREQVREEINELKQ